jgi:broad specificity phosphatase PhoE
MTGTIAYLARHAHHAELGRVLSGRCAELPLSADGREQARQLAVRLEGRDVSMIETSPQQRAQETAAIIAQRLDVPLHVRPALDEIDFGAWSGRPFSELDADPHWHRWNDRRASVAPPYGESMSDAARRIVGHLAGLAEEGRSGVLCVTHCDMIRGAVAFYLGLGFDNLFRFEVDPASLTTLALNDGSARLLSLNERAP